MSVTFPRTIVPREATWPTMPAALATWGQSGKVQTRTTGQLGRQWTETYGPMRASSADARSLLAKLAAFWREGTVLDVDHRSQRAMIGAGTGTPLVAGASQSGTTLVTDGWTAATSGIMKAGDVFRVAGSNLVYEVTADATSLASGTCTLTISPGIVVGASPADNAAITTNAVNGSVLYRCVLAEEVQMPSCGPDEVYYGLRVTFRETG